MPQGTLDPLSAVQSLGQALLIGLLIGVQRESTEGVHPGLRDFLLIAVSGGICGLLGLPWLTAAALLSVTALLAVYRMRSGPERTGITTELAGVATFCITYLTASGIPDAAPLAIGTAIAVVAFLEFKKRLQQFFRETITEREFNDTLAFLAVVLVIYPLLPVGRYGPYGFFSPREVWFYVILISSISYAGYFFQKFLGEKGLAYTAVLGGIASTLATTLDLARRSRHDPQRSASYARAAVIANTVQFPRTLIILVAANQVMARAAALPLITGMCAGAGLSWLFSRLVSAVPAQSAPSGNPFRLKPAITFGALFAAIVLLNKAASQEFGWQALYVTSVLGGLVDPGTVILSSSDLLNHGSLTRAAAVAYVFVALAGNILMKSLIALVAGSHAFAWRLVSALVLIFGTSIGVLILLK